MHRPEPYAFEEPRRGRPPGLTGEVIVRDSADEVIDALLADLIIHAANCVRAFGDFQLMLPGCSAATPVLRRLMYDPNLRDFPWSRTRVWVTDDVLVPEDDPRSRTAQLRAHIAEHSGIPPSQFHAIPRGETDHALRYEAEIREVLGWREKGHDRPDYVLLVLGVCANSVTAPASAADDRLVVEVPAARGEPAIVSISTALIRASRFVAVYAGGEEARAALAAIERPDQPERGPARALRPLGGELKWYIDPAAMPDPARA